MIDKPNVELTATYNDLQKKAKILNIDLPDNIDDFAEKWYNNEEYRNEIIIKKNLFDALKKQIEGGDANSLATIDTVYKAYKEYQKYGEIITKDGIKVGELRTHAIYRLLTRNKKSVSDLVNILKNAKGRPKGNGNFIYTLDNKFGVIVGKDEKHNIVTTLYVGRGIF